ncbi:hypothetical protein BS47DRAFT_380192 [Hydnum rufescens UP504]|uniref:Uncharacterized protein n=1 Tax=Hydnum rufescens UP504 TaxID=1448309 RepID=A0A9P6DPZ9_9AGAM|nr:hypothetical protein BS47DRAFT_380192 [Hydnum rufescens UP504]
MVRTTVSSVVSLRLVRKTRPEGAWDGIGNFRSPEYQLGPSQSLAEGAPIFAVGEYVLIRIPIEIKLGGNTATGSAAESELLPTSKGSSPQHFAFIRSVYPLLDGSYQLEVYPQLPLSRSGGALIGYNQTDDTGRAALIPLPPLSHRYPTPERFGDPLVVGGWSNSRDAWLYTVPHRFVMPWTRPFKRMIPPVSMNPFEMRRVDVWYNALRASLVAPDLGDRHDEVPPEGGLRKDDGRGNVALRQGDGGQAASGNVPESTGVSWAGGGVQKRTLEAEVEQLVHNLSSGEPLILEGVDEDAQDEDCTPRDQLILLGRSHPSWAKVLVKYLVAEQEERQEVEERRAARLEHWLQGMTV